MKYFKIVINIILIFCIIGIGEIFYLNKSYAASGIESLGSLDSYKGDGANSSRLKTRTETILGILQVIGVVISVIILMVMGMKYMFGSVEEKSEFKETMIPYLIGAALVFSGTTIPQIIYQISQNINK